MTTTPHGCGHCGIPERVHSRQWTEAAGWHQWAAPSNAQILARMKARRTARTNPTTEEQP